MRFQQAIRFIILCALPSTLIACGTPQADEPVFEEFTFTEDDVAEFRSLVQRDEKERSAIVGTGSTALEAPVVTDALPDIDLSMIGKYNAIRSVLEESDANEYKVTHTFLNVRSEPRVTAQAIDRLDQGASIHVIDFPNAAWARVQLPDGREGYVALRYIAKVVTEEALADEKKAFDGMYFVDFGFLNIRKTPDTTSEKIGELPGQTIVRPLSMDDVWARLLYEGNEGHVAREYLSAFQPSFLVRQEEFAVPIVHYRLTQSDILDVLPKHLDRLKQEGFTIVPLSAFYDVVLEQQERDVRMGPRSVILAFSDVSAENVDELSDVLRLNAVPATLFIPSKEFGIDGITEKNVLTLMANGFDVQSGGHTADDLRSLTNAQVELELRQSRQIIENLTGKAVYAISYPLGGVNERIASMVQETGFLFGVGASPKNTLHRREFLRLPSLLVSSSMTADDVIVLVRGNE